jgi:hypothetical protein
VTLNTELPSQTTERIAAALCVVLSDIAAAASEPPRDPAGGPVESTANAIFAELTSRRFSYLGRTQSEPYREPALRWLRADVAEGRPASFFFDIGPGYHAGIAPDDLSLSFDVGLAELMALRQVAAFCRRVREVYPAGARFHLVVDNLCGVATNDILLENTLEYVVQLRRLIDELAIGDIVSVLVESELHSWDVYRDRLEREPWRPLPAAGAAEVGNVARFLGRSCTTEEAATRIELYRRTGIVTEELLEPAISGVRLTQRATPATLGFRAFPGADQRIQVGQLALRPGRRGRLRPILITSRNYPRFEVTRVETKGVLPDPIRTILYAEPGN